LRVIVNTAPSRAVRTSLIAQPYWRACVTADARRSGR